MEISSGKFSITSFIFVFVSMDNFFMQILEAIYYFLVTPVKK
jgi:hypothetical protein